MNRQKIRLMIALLATILFPVIFYYLSPYLIIMGAAQGIIAGDALTFAGLFVASLFFGRAWCGWLCPGGAVQDLCAHINSKSFNGRKRNLLKYVIWAPWIGMVVLLFIQAGGIRAFDPLYMTWNGISVHDLPSAIMFLAIAGAFFAVALAVGKRSICHCVCWMAPFMVAGMKIRNAVGHPSLHLEADTSRCLKCRKCNSKCPMSLDVAKMVQDESFLDTECILCGSCVDSCPKRVIEYSFGRLKPGRKSFDGIRQLT